MTNAHNITVELGADQGDGRHMTKIVHDGHVLIHEGLTCDDLDRFTSEVRRAALGAWEREHPMATGQSGTVGV